MTVFALSQHLAHRRDDEVRDIVARWTQNGAPSGTREEVATLLRSLVSDGERVAGRIKQLPKRMALLLESYLREPGYMRTLKAVLADRTLGFQNQYEVEAALSALQREGLLFPTTGRHWMAYGQPAHAVPVEVAVALESFRRKLDRGLLDTLTLKGFLERKHFRQAAARGEAEEGRKADHLRQTYKLFLEEQGVVQRIGHLTPRTRQLFEQAMTAFGGLMPHDLLLKLEGDEARFDPGLVRNELEEHSLGTIADLDLSRFGMRNAQEVLVVFNEITLGWLRTHCLVGDGGQTNGAQGNGEPLEEHAAGVDLASNVSRFLRFVEEQPVKLTVRGEVFKSTERRFLERLILPAHGEVEPVEMLAFITGYCAARGLLERTGERRFKLSAAGVEFEQKDLAGKLQDMLAYAVEERGLPGEHYHQVRMRRILMRLLRRVDEGRWNDAMFLPFLARNSYLSQLDQLAVEEFFESRFHAGRFAPSEDVQQVCWNLFTWMKRRLHLLGIVDLGYRNGRVAAVRLSQLGGQILGVGTAAKAEGARSTLVVNPDFEVIVFPEADVFELVHALDRFCLRLKSDRLYQFRIEEASVRSGLADGLTIADVIDLLTRRARAALPQNVLFSLRDWADKAGVLTVEKVLLVSARRAEQLDRFVELPQVKPHVMRRLSATSVALSARFAVAKLKPLLRELGFFLEADKPEA